MTRISIALATYNGERYIAEQLDSLAAQSRLPDQLIVCDDGSTDMTVAIAEQFATRAPFHVNVSRNPRNLGYSANFAHAISLCDGDILFLSDQDDVWFADKIATVAQAFEDGSLAEVVINDQVLTDESLRHSGLTKLQNLRRAGKTDAAMIEGCSTALRLEWARLLFPMPADADELVQTRVLSHDRWINELAMLVGRRIVIERPLQYFRRTGQNTTSWRLSEPRQPTFKDIVGERRSVAPVAAWRSRIAVLEVYKTFVERHVNRGDKAAALRKIAHERSSHEQRIRLASLPRARRPAAIWRLWRSGGYHYFERWLSAISDLARR